MFARIAQHPGSLVVLVLIIIVVFGWKRLPDAARSLGRSTRILKSELDDMNAESKASKETVQGETSPPPHSGSVPGEAPPAQAPQQPATPPQQPQSGSVPGQSTPGNQGTQQGS